MTDDLEREEETSGDDGGSALSKRQQQSMDRIERKAIMEDWPEPTPAIKQAIINRQSKIAIDPNATERDSTRAFVALNKLSERKEKIATERLNRHREIMAAKEAAIEAAKIAHNSQNGTGPADVITDLDDDRGPKVTIYLPHNNRETLGE